MKKLNLLMGILSLSVFTFSISCNSSEKSAAEEPVKSNTEIPEGLSKNEKVKEYFETLEKVVDEYANMMEEIIKNGQNAQKKDGGADFSDAVGMLSDISSSTVKMAPLLEKMEKLEKEAEIMKKEMSPEEAEAFSKTYAKIMARYYEMGKKLETNK